MWLRASLFIAGLLLIGWLEGGFGLRVRAADAEQNGYEPGLIGRATDADRTVEFAAPTPHFHLSPGQSIHPQLRPPFELQWAGYLRILRGGEYTFLGEGELYLNDGPVPYGQAIELEPGYLPLRIEFHRRPGDAQLNLRWRSDFFPPEPMPSRVFWRQPLPSDNTRARQLERGRRLIEQFNCIACHSGNAGFWRGRSGPDLSTIGSRTSADWIYHFLADPRDFRSGTVMPVILETSQDRADVAAYLATLDRTSAPDQTVEQMPAEPESGAGEKGKAMFEWLGCQACHQSDALALDGLGSKYSTGSLARYLRDPLAADPSGRMPDFNLSRGEAESLARYLVQSRQSAFEEPAPPGDPDRGKNLVADNGCLACHTLNDPPNLTNRQSAPAFEALRPRNGCLAESVSDRVPRFPINREERDALRAFVDSSDVSPAPIQDFHRTIAQFRCQACHEIYEPARHELAEAPPPLTVAGRKMRTDWLEAVLYDRKRVRPWMDLRMPHYGRDNLQGLPDWFAAQAGVPAGHGEEWPEPTPDQIAAGVSLLGQGQGGLSCISCHDVQGHRAVGEMRGPDLAEMHDRIRPDWFRRWMRDPARIIPGTAMPAFFSGMPASETDRMIDQLLAALSRGKEMPLPDGVLKPAENFHLTVREEPVVIRTSMPHSSPQSIAVGLPGGIHYCFDAAACRLRYSWQGDFLDMEPVWSGRGGQPPRLLGSRNFIAREELPFQFEDADATPEIQFVGYRLVDRIPQFRYRVDGVLVKERIIGAAGKPGLVRQFEIGPVPREILLLVRDTPESSVTSTSGELANGRVRIPAEGVVRFELRVVPNSVFE